VLNVLAAVYHAMPWGYYSTMILFPICCCTHEVQSANLPHLPLKMPLRYDPVFRE